jgi:hypothetical protein
MNTHHLPAAHAAAKVSHLAGYTHGNSAFGLLVLAVVLLALGYVALHRPQGFWW